MHIVGFDPVSYAFGCFSGIFFFFLIIFLVAFKNRGEKK